MYRPNKKRSSPTSKEAKKIASPRLPTGPRWGRGRLPGSPTKKERNETAVQKVLTDLGVDREKLAAVPQFTDMFRIAAVDGLVGALKMLRFRRDVEIIDKFLAAADSVDPNMHTFIPWEAFVVKAGIDPIAFVGAAVLALRDYNVQMVKIMAVTHHPSVMAVRIKEAKKAGGWRDRNAIDMAMKFLPSPKGATFIFPAANEERDISVKSDVVTITAAEVPAEQIDHHDVFPDIEETQKLLGE